MLLHPTLFEIGINAFALQIVHKANEMEYYLFSTSAISVHTQLAMHELNDNVVQLCCEE